jgi:D-alanine--D-alanine ligase
MAKPKVLVLFGGASKDYDTSLYSAYSVLKVLFKHYDKVEVIPVGITRAGRWLYFPGSAEELTSNKWEENSDCCSAILSPDPNHGGIVKILPDENTVFQRADLIFSVLHGKYGECGQIQGLCKLSGVKYLGCGLGAAYVCSDIALTHLILKNAGVKTAQHCCIERCDIEEAEKHLPDFEKYEYPLRVRASSRSSGIGESIANNADELRKAILIAFSHHHKVIIEEVVDGRSLEVVVGGNACRSKVSKIGETVTRTQPTEFTGGLKELVTADLSEPVKEKVTETAKKIYSALDCSGVVGISLKLTGQNEVCFSELRGTPGFGEIGVFAKFAAETYEAGILEMLGDII